MIFLDFQVFESKFAIFLMSISKWQVHSSSNFALLVIAMTYRTPLLNFKLIQFLLWTKGSHQSPNFVTLVLTWKFAKFLIFFKTQVSFSSNFATIFHVMKDNSSVLFRLTIIYFGHKESIKQFFRLLSAQSGQNLSNSSCKF